MKVIGDVGGLLNNSSTIITQGEMSSIAPAASVPQVSLGDEHRDGLQESASSWMVCPSCQEFKDQLGNQFII